MPAKPLAPGRYEIVATVRQGDASAEERTAFEVQEATGAPVAAAAPPPAPADLVPVLEQAARYVLDYEQAFHDVAARAQVATEYRAEPRLAMWVPAEMREEYAFGSRAEATARYSSFRKFTVTVEDETATLPPETPEAPPEP